MQTRGRNSVVAAMLWADDARAFAIAMGCVVRHHAGFQEYFGWASAEGPEELLVQFGQVHAERSDEVS